VARQAKLKDQIKSLTLLIVGISIIAYGFPRLSDLLVYDRQAILSGELWRLLTAPFVHFSPSHIFWDVLVFGAAGFAIEAAGYRGFWLICTFATIIPSLVFLLTSPELEFYGGLSGLAIGAVAYFCLCNVLKRKKNRVIWVFILVGMGAKIVAETAMGFPLFVQTGSIAFRLLPSVHIIGYLGAFAAIIWIRPNMRSDADRLKTTPVA
jgi:rhomboid family GlyGly-CTERM serine protease